MLSEVARQYAVRFYSLLKPISDNTNTSSHQTQNTSKNSLRFKVICIYTLYIYYVYIQILYNINIYYNDTLVLYQSMHLKSIIQNVGMFHINIHITYNNSTNMASMIYSGAFEVQVALKSNHSKQLISHLIFSKLFKGV